MNLTTDSLNNLMKKDDIGLDLLITKVITSPERYLLMKQNRLLPDLLLEVPIKLLQTSGWTEHQPQDLTYAVFVYGRPHPDGSEEPPLMSTINFDDPLGRSFLLHMDENGERKRATTSDHVCTLDQYQVSRDDKLRSNS